MIGIFFSDLACLDYFGDKPVIWRRQEVTLRLIEVEVEVAAMSIYQGQSLLLPGHPASPPLWPATAPPLHQQYIDYNLESHLEHDVVHSVACV